MWVFDPSFYVIPRVCYCDLRGLIYVGGAIDVLTHFWSNLVTFSHMFTCSNLCRKRQQKKNETKYNWVVIL